MESRPNAKITYQVLTFPTVDSELCHTMDRPISSLTRSSLEDHVKYCLRAAILTEQGLRTFR